MKKIAAIIGLLLLTFSQNIWGQTDSLRISWNANPEPDMLSYRLYRSVNGSGAFQLIQTLMHPQTQTVDRNGITPGSLYAFRLAAVDSAGNQSLFSDTVAVGVPQINWTLTQITTAETTVVALSNIINDPDNALANLQLFFSGQNHVIVSRSGNNLLLVPTPFSYTGPAGFSLRVEDPAGFWDYENIPLNITQPVNQPPVITSTPVTNATVTVAYQYPVTASDPDPGDVLTFGLTSAPSFLQINTTTGLISGTPAVSDSGTHPVTVRVTDLQGASDTQSYQLQVLYLNQPPVVSNIPRSDDRRGSKFCIDKSGQLRDRS